ncbi:P-loop containing nucleoside triphosphate hydrolase protein [Bimuria novae-zelandiae CBS 107.79]|uniref:P-loop containing nucleoside triphosphate hydrolase protein n=1 Tax=Bimuria novae-zelandiae CBS 107.79 TaxID=1447943 RepID=A0A6A5V6F5_9PLEO|nr:P-loop containing nucleoside triphosphate hydrolase protein [Bimuria novae-zelandiae CBS 107.79]
MDFSRLESLQYELNATNSSATNLPSTLLELVVPGYSTISQVAFRLLGIDIGVLVTGWALIFGCRTAWRYTYDLVQGYLEEHYTSSIQIDDDDDLFDYVKAWLAGQQTKRPSRKLKAVTDYDDNNKKNEDNISDVHGIYKYELPIPRYEPSYGSDNEFQHNGRTFRVSRSSMKDDNRGNNLKESLEIFCYGQTTQPIKDLLLHIRSWKVKQETSMTSVYRPLSGGYWSRQSCRPSRPLQTVSLDQEQKDDIVEDINEFLHPATARWYAARGIPHRRGYLFHGPPGTGKTSLSFALAGVFGLQVYCVSLNDKDLTEPDLCSLFDDLPDRCIVLLEDIDSAGLKREEEPSSTEEKKEGETESETSKDVAKQTSKTETSGGISLSALLNVIDGAAAHEGHVLIMTTNTPETLDAALIRPGRVDLQVAFTLATRAQIHETFMRMYSATPEEQATGSRIPIKSRPVSKITDPETLEGMARRFAEQLPESTFSPAEVQGYLLTRKKDPQRALDDVVRWRDEVLEAKKKGKRLVGAQ